MPPLMRVPKAGVMQDLAAPARNSAACVTLVAVLDADAGLFSADFRGKLENVETVRLATQLIEQRLDVRDAKLRIEQTARGLTVAARKRGCGSGKRIAFSGEAQALRELLPRGGEKPFATSPEIGY